MEEEIIQEKRQYELAVLLDNDSAESQLADFLAKNKIENFQKESSKTINLAYPVKKHNTAVLNVYFFSSEPGLVSNIKEELRLQSYALRSLFITPPIAKPQKTAVAITNKEIILDIKPPHTEAVSNESLEETLEKILQ